jgi:hypothetical protein
MKNCLESDIIPDVGPDCEYCAYAKKRTEMTLQAITKLKKQKLAK